MPATASVSSTTSQSKWYASRLSNCRIVVVGDAEVMGDHLLCDRRRRGAAVLAGMLGEHRDRDLRTGDGCEGDEPRMVFALARHVPLLGALGAELPHLRGAGLAADLDTLHPRLRAGAAVRVHDVGERLADLQQGRLLETEVALDDGLFLADERAVGRLDALHELRPVDGAVVRDRGDHVRHLQRRRRHVALADRDRERLAGVPRLAEALPFPRAARDDAAALVLERDAGRRAEPEAVRVLGDRVDAEPLPDLIEEDVARAHQRLVHVHVAVPLRAPATELAIAEPDAAATEDLRERVDE